MVSDDEILAAQKIMAAGEGIFGEPAWLPYAGLLKMVKKGWIFG